MPVHEHSYKQFILDTHPEYSNIVIGAGFSGHGFTFASAIDEVLAGLAVSGETEHDIELVDIGRFELS